MNKLEIFDMLIVCTYEGDRITIFFMCTEVVLLAQTANQSRHYELMFSVCQTFTVEPRFFRVVNFFVYSKNSHSEVFTC